MDPGFFPQIFKLFFALSLVLLLMGGLYYILKRLGMGGGLPVNATRRRLKIIETLPIDARRRLMIIQRDEKQHLVILGTNSETVVEADIDVPQAAPGKPSKLKAIHPPRGISQTGVDNNGQAKKILDYIK